MRRFGYTPDRLLLQSLAYTKGSTTLFSTNYWYKTDSTNCPNAASGNNGQIQCITDTVDSGRNASYAYDALYRLTSAVTKGSTNYPTWGLSMSYDRYGNRTGQSISSGCTGITCPTNSVTVSASTNQLSGSPFAYDANGNMTNDGGNTLVYDAENRMLSATNGSASGTYSYDGNSLRVKKVSGSTTTVYIFSGSKVIAEYANGAAPSAPTREYIYSGGALLAKIESGATKYFHQDHLSNRVVTDSTGTAVEQLGHFPFGESWYNASSDKLLFTSYERDAESGNDFAMARSYVNRLARFSSPDVLSGSIGNPQSLNRYAYVLSDPVNSVDPLGMHGGPRFACGMDGLGCGGPNGWWDWFGGGGGCSLDGMAAPCSIVFDAIGAGAAAQCPNNDCTGVTRLQGDTFYGYRWGKIDDNTSYGYLCNGESGPAGFPTCNQAIFGETEQGWAMVPVGQNTVQSNWFWDLWSAYWSQAPWTFSIGVDSGTIANAGVSIPISYIPKTNTLCAGLGPALSVSLPGEDVTVNGGPLMLVSGNPRDVIEGPSLNWNVQPVPFVGYQHSVNTSGQVAGPTLGSVDGSLSFTAAGCVDIKR